MDASRDEFTYIDLPELEDGESWDTMLITAAIGEVVPHEYILTRGAEFAQYGQDTSMDTARADIAVLAQSIGHVRHVLHVASFYAVPVYLRCLASGLSGGAVPVRGGIVLDTSPMDKLLSVNRGNRSCRVQPGLTVQELNRRLAEYGLWFPPWPSSHDISGIGGNIAENAGGITTVKYGTTRDWLLGLTCVLPGGEVIRTGAACVKDVAGLDLTSVICGSEGMLCAVVEAELQLAPLPGAVGTATLLFDSDEAALAAAQVLLAGPITPRTLEFIDATVMQCVVKQLGDEAREALGDVEGMAGAEARPTNNGGAADSVPPSNAPAMLAIETDAHSAADALAQLETATAALTANGGRLLGQTTDRAEALKLWRVRSELSPACHQLGEYKLSEDVVVPRDRLVDLLTGIKAIGEARGLRFLNYGHLGDGNFHATLMFADEHDPRLSEGRAAIGDLCRLAVSLGGSITGEHGIGTIKREHLPLMRSEAEIELMRGIKRAFDPRGIMNPGKWL